MLLRTCPRAASLGRLGQARLFALPTRGTDYGWPKRPPLGTGKLARDLQQASSQLRAPDRRVNTQQISGSRLLQSRKDFAWYRPILTGHVIEKGHERNAKDACHLLEATCTRAVRPLLVLL